MLTVPSPPLKFRTARFPQYSFKATNLKPAPGIRSLPRSLLLSFARFHHKRSPGSASKTIEASTCRCSRDLPSLPPGVLGSGSSCAASIHPRLLLPWASPAGTLRLHVYAYTQRLRCAGAPRRPARPSLLSLPCFPCMPLTLPRWFIVFSRCAPTMIPDFLELLVESATTAPISASYFRRGSPFPSCIIRLCYSMHVCPSLLWLATTR
jgi:hypothetical protein